MKPKHRVFCPFALRHKMLFTTEQKALLHIRYNAAEYTSTTIPVRAYYCDGCGGWHLTHLSLDEYQQRKGTP